MSLYSSKQYPEKHKLYNYFLAQGHDGDFLRDLLIQCNWSKTQTARALEEMTKGHETSKAPPGKKDKATGQKTGYLSPEVRSSQDTSATTPPTNEANKQSSPKLLEDRKYRQLIERGGHFRMTFYLGEVEFRTQELREFAPRVFFESSHLKYLSDRLKWWNKYGDFAPLAPLRTQGDGNCLLHAVSRAVFGVEDEGLILRRLLHTFLSNPVEVRPLKARWKRQQAVLNGHAGFEFDASEWENEWQTIVSLASLDISIPEPNLNSADIPSLPYKSLEEIHIFALAYVISRPIIVIANSMLQDVDGRAISPVYFGGVYLPLDRDPKECYHIPVVLTYCCSHFAPLVACYNDLITPGDNKARFRDVVVPLVGPEGDKLQIQFLEGQLSSLDTFYTRPSSLSLTTLREYLYIENIPISQYKTILAARICPCTHEFYSDIIKNLLAHTEAKLIEYKSNKAREEKEKEAKSLSFLSSYPPSPYQLTSSYPSRTLPSSILPTPLSNKLSPRRTTEDSPYSHKPDLYRKSATRSDTKITEITTTISPRTETYRSPPRPYRMSPPPDSPAPYSYYTREKSTNTDMPKSHLKSSYLEDFTAKYSLPSVPSSSSYYTHSYKPELSYRESFYTRDASLNKVASYPRDTSYLSDTPFYPRDIIYPKESSSLASQKLYPSHSEPYSIHPVTASAIESDRKKQSNSSPIELMDLARDLSKMDYPRKKYH